MIGPADVAAVLVTRGDVDVTPVVESLPFTTVVWDNSTADADLTVYGRYSAISLVQAPVIFVQDDDALLPPESIAQLLAAYRPGAVVANMPARFRAHYSDSCLVGFGALFDRGLPAAAFDRFLLHESPDGALGDVVPGAVFRRCCDVVFTALTPAVWLDLPYRELPYATGEGRMYRQPGHTPERDRVLRLARRVRDTPVAA